MKLADGKARTIQHMMCTTFWHPDGTPMSAKQFMELLFGKLPEFFSDEAELRVLWSDPETRRKLLDGLCERGFGREQLGEMQRIIDAEKSRPARGDRESLRGLPEVPVSGGVGARPLVAYSFGTWRAP